MSRLLLIMLAMFGYASALHAQVTPKFTDYPAPVYRGKTAAVKLDTPDTRNMRTRLRAGAREPVNFAGHHILTTWGCGNACQTGAVINAKTGGVVFLPHTVCCWKEGDEPFYYRKDSRLLVFGGMLDEEEPGGAHFFEFTGDGFRRIGKQRSNPISTDADLKMTIARVVELIDQGEMPQWGEPDFLTTAKPYLSDQLRIVIHDGAEAALRTGANIWDAETLTGAQGLIRAKFFSAVVTDSSNREATVTVEIGLSDEDVDPQVGTKYRYDMLFEDGAWKIDDITTLDQTSEDQKSLKEVFRSAMSASTTDESSPGDEHEPEPDVVDLDVPLAGERYRIDNETFRLKVCNNSKADVDFAFNAREKAGEPKFITFGWLKVKKGECQNTGPFWKGDFFYTAAGGNKLWGQGVRMCVQADSFKLPYKAGGRCRSGFTMPFSRYFATNDFETISLR